MEEEIRSLQPNAKIAYVGLTIIDGYALFRSEDMKGLYVINLS